MAPIIYKINNPKLTEKMVALDYDWTLVKPNNGKTFPSNIDDWQYLFPNIKKKLNKYFEDNYMIVIFTNQSKTWKLDQISLVAKDLNIPIFVVIAFDKKEYKPHIIIFNDFIQNYKINKKESFYVGDALGRKTDFSDSDKLFAENIGIKYYSPEEIFYIKENFDIPEIPLSSEPEIIIMVGYPGSGKTTISNNICKNNNYILIEGDLYKTSKSMIQNSIKYINEKKSIIFDATNNSIKKRKEYIELAKKFNYKINCIHVNTSLDISYERNKSREENKHVPKIAYSVYQKYYEEPNKNEGFNLLHQIY